MTAFDATRFNPTRTHAAGDMQSDLHQHRSFEICRAIDLIALDSLLGSMVAKGHIKENQARLFKSQASILRAHLLTENNRSLNF